MPNLKAVGSCPVGVFDPRLDALPRTDVVLPQPVPEAAEAIQHYERQASAFCGRPVGDPLTTAMAEALRDIAGATCLAAALDNTLQAHRAALRDDGLRPVRPYLQEALLSCQSARAQATALVGFALLKVAEAARRCPGQSTRRAFLAALAARNAAIEGDGAAVDDFARTWLGLDHPERWRPAVEMALLGHWVDALGGGTADDPAVVALLRGHTDVEHRQLQPLWERRTRGKRVTLLSCPVGDGLTLADVVADRRSPEALVVDGEFRDGRVATVLGQLAAPAREVACAWAHGKESWEKAAIRADQPADYGETVRRRLKRLGKRHVARAAAAAAAKKADPACP